jgi:hypothetical protein
MEEDYVTPFQMKAGRTQANSPKGGLSLLNNIEYRVKPKLDSMEEDYVTPFKMNAGRTQAKSLRGGSSVPH